MTSSAARSNACMPVQLWVYTCAENTLNGTLLSESALATHKTALPRTLNEGGGCIAYNIGSTSWACSAASARNTSDSVSLSNISACIAKHAGHQLETLLHADIGQKQITRSKFTSLHT